jgi:thymidylate kinase
MIIIVEGVDRVGKTTLCNLLKEQLGLQVYKKEREGGNDGKGPLELLVNYGNATGHLSFWESDICKDLSFVVDRFQWTETVYSTILRKNPNDLMDNVNHWLEEMDNVLMVLIKPTDIDWSSNQHGEDLRPYEELYEKLYDEYRGQKISATHETLQEVVDYIREKVTQ